MIFLFDNMTSARDMWNSLISVYEENNQVDTRVKESRLESKNEQELS
jgi:hypothetical protein